MKMSRRSFLFRALAAGAAAVLAGRKLVCAPAAKREDSKPAGKPMPPGAASREEFTRKCVGCQLCVKSCPSQVLRRGAAADGFRPYMDFELDWCKPGCVKCSNVCPAGALLPVTRDEKAVRRTGVAVWNQNSCIAATEGVRCTACSRHCRAQAISLKPLYPGDIEGPKVPEIDAEKCIGCGACEHYCPAKPGPAIKVAAD